MIYVTAKIGNIESNSTFSFTVITPDVPLFFESVRKVIFKNFGHIFIIGMERSGVASQSDHMHIEYDGHQYPVHLSEDNQAMGWNNNPDNINNINDGFLRIIKKCIERADAIIARAQYYFKFILNQKVIKFTATDFRLHVSKLAKIKISATSIHTKNAERVADSIIAMAEATILDVGKWQSAQLNEIVAAGIKLCGDHPDTCTSPGSDNTEFSFAGKTFKIKLNPNNHIQGDLSLHDTTDKLAQFFGTDSKSHQQCIIMANDHHVTIFKRGNHFYLFVSHWRGAIEFDGVDHHDDIMLIETENIVDLADVVVRDLGLVSKEKRFTIYSLVVESSIKAKLKNVLKKGKCF